VVCERECPGSGQVRAELDCANDDLLNIRDEDDRVTRSRNVLGIWAMRSAGGLIGIDRGMIVRCVGVGEVRGIEAARCSGAMGGDVLSGDDPSRRFGEGGVDVRVVAIVGMGQDGGAAEDSDDHDGDHDDRQRGAEPFGSLEAAEQGRAVRERSTRHGDHQRISSA
jgi:hypothetical protein